MFFIAFSATCLAQSQSDSDSVVQEIQRSLPFAGELKGKSFDVTMRFSEATWNTKVAEGKKVNLVLRPAIIRNSISVFDGPKTFRLGHWLEPEVGVGSLPVHYGKIVEEWICTPRITLKLSDNKASYPPAFFTGKKTATNIQEILTENILLLGGKYRFDDGRFVDLLDCSKAVHQVAFKGGNVFLEIKSVNGIESRWILNSDIAMTIKQLEVIRDGEVLVTCFGFAYNDFGMVHGFRGKSLNGDSFSVACSTGISGESLSTNELKFSRPPRSNFVSINNDSKQFFQLSDSGEIAMVVDASVLTSMPNSYPLANRGKVRELNASPNDSAIFKPYLRSMSSMHCGIYSAGVVSDRLGKKVDLVKYLNEDYVSTKAGSTVLDIEDMFYQVGFPRSMHSVISVGLLQKTNAPAVLHFSKSYQAEGVSHWVAFVGMASDGRFRIVDSPHDEVLMTGAELMTQWDGLAIFPSNSNSQGYPISTSHRAISLLQNCWTFFPAVLALGLLSLAGRPENFSAWKRGAIFLMAILLSLASWQVFSTNSYFNNPSACQHSASKTSLAKHNTAGELKVIYELPKDENESVVIVDARVPRAFQQGHFPNAVNLPVDASLNETNLALAKVEGAKKIVVYCQSSSCTWAESVGQRLAIFVDAEISVYRPGWNKLQQYGRNGVDL